MADLTVNSIAQYVQKDYSKMNLNQLEKEHASIFSQAQTAAQNYPELAAQYNFIDKKIDYEIDKKLYSSTNDTSAKEALGFVNGQISDLESKLQQISQKRTELSVQTRAVIDTNPILAARNHIKDVNMSRQAKLYEIQLKDLQEQKSGLTNGNADLAEKIASKGSVINALESELQQNTQKRMTLSYQAQAAAENYPALAEQYHTLDKKLESEAVDLEAQIRDLQQEKADLIAQNTVQTAQPAAIQNQNSLLDIFSQIFKPAEGQNQQNILIQILMLALQALFTNKN